MIALLIFNQTLKNNLKLGLNSFTSLRIGSERNFKRTSTKNQTVLEDLEIKFTQEGQHFQERENRGPGDRWEGKTSYR